MGKTVSSDDDDEGGEGKGRRRRDGRLVAMEMEMGKKEREDAQARTKRGDLIFDGSEKKEKRDFWPRKNVAASLCLFFFAVQNFRPRDLLI